MFKQYAIKKHKSCKIQNQYTVKQLVIMMYILFLWREKQ